MMIPVNNSIYKIVQPVINYFSNFEEIYTRKNFNMFLFIASLAFYLMLYLAVDKAAVSETFKALQQSAGSQNQEMQLGLMEQLGALLPNPLLINLFSIILIPAIVKRMNDTNIHIAFIAPVIITAVVDFINSALQTNISFYAYGAMSMYTPLFFMLLCMYPGNNNKDYQ